MVPRDAALPTWRGRCVRVEAQVGRMLKIREEGTGCDDALFARDFGNAETQGAVGEICGLRLG